MPIDERNDQKTAINMNVKVWCAVVAVLFSFHSTEGRWVEDNISTDAVSKMRLIFWAEIAFQVLRAEREREKRERERERECVVAQCRCFGLVLFIFSALVFSLFTRTQLICSGTLVDFFSAQHFLFLFLICSIRTSLAVASRNLALVQRVEKTGVQNCNV